MATIIDLAERSAQKERERTAARAQHPSLRWVAGTAFYVAHRKDGAEAACGAEGGLTLAPPGVPLCVACYPRTSSQESAG